MVPRVALLSLLGLAALTGIHSAPVENDDHTGEMITRCIIEVLLNSLSKGNSPVINPQCKELLKKSEQQKQREKNIQQDMELVTRTLSESEELSKQSEGTVREEQDVSEEEFKRQAEGDARWHLEMKKYGESSNQQTASPGTPYALNRAHKEEKKNENEKGAEEDNYKINYHNGDGDKEKKVSGEAESEPLEKKSILTSGKMNEEDYKHTHGQKYVEEIIQSQERENEDSEEEEEEKEEEEEEESNEKYHHSFHEEFEDSSERDGGETEKQDHKSGHYRRKPRLGKSFEYNRHHTGEKRGSSEEPSEEESELWVKRSHHPNNYERGRYFVEPRNSIEMHRSEEMERESRSKGYWDQHYPSQEDSDEDMKRHSGENERNQYQYMRKRLFGGPSREIRHHYEAKVPYNKARKGNGGMKQSYNIDEKRHHDQPNVQLEMAKPQNKEREDGEQQLNNQEAREEKHYPSNDGELETSHYNERGKHSDNKRTLLLEDGYPRSHYLVENVKRALNPFYYQQPRWKNRLVDKNADIINSLLESEEEHKSHLNKREFFPEYNDYDLWEKKQILDSLNPKQDNNNNPERLYKPEIKRQYDRMDELAHLLSYRKKSAEFPELYSSKEDVERGHVIRSGKDKFNERPLTPEEEKELENLAAMDLELQKIAEKFNNNQRG